MKFLKPLLVFAILLTFDNSIYSQEKSKSVIMIVHGTWGGGWAFKEVDELLTEAGHLVYRPTLTGNGERFHLSSPDIDLKTHINDVISTITFEEIYNVTLIGHSYGGMVITGVADSIPERIRKLIYVDAVYPKNTESVYEALGSENLTWVKVENRYLVPTWVNETTTPPMDVPQPQKTWTDKIILKNSSREKIPTEFILTVDKGANPEDDLFFSQAERVRLKGWNVIQLEADHNPHRTALIEFVSVLQEAIK